VGHHIDLPTPLPLLVRRRGCVIRIAAEIADARIGAEQINGPGAACRFGNEVLNVGLFADIAGHCESADGLRYGFGAGGVAVGYDDRLGALLVESLDERATDPVGPSGDNDDAACDVHVFSPRC
jgi:hypothetical protein